MPDIVDWQRADPREVIPRAARCLGAGELVAFPTESTYVVACHALHARAAGRLAELGGPGSRPAIVIGSAAEALDWVPGFSPLGRRLARRCWPGPLTLRCGDRLEQGLVSRLPGRVRALLGEEVGLRMPAHEALLEVGRFLPGPVLAAPAGNGTPATTAGRAADLLGDRLALVLDDGPGRFAQGPTVVAVQGASWRIVQEGVLSRAALEQLLPCRIVFVCTGNTCRSPLAQVLCQQLLAGRQGCTVEELPAHGFCVLSAGISAMIGEGAAEEAVATARELGADLTGHRTQPLTRELLAQADHLIAMTHGHLRALEATCGQAGPRPRLLAPDGQDIPDPIGASPEVYRQCAERIRQALQELLPELC